MVVFVELLKNLFVGEEEFLLDLLINCVFLGVDEVVYVKVGFLVVIVKGEVKFFLLILEKVIELLGIMQGGYNIYLLIDVLDDVKLVLIVVKVFFYILLMFDNFYDVEEKVKVGNEYVKQVMQFWVDVEWFLNCLVLVEKLIVIVFKVIGEINIDDFFLVLDVWLCLDILLYVLVMLKNVCEGIELDQLGVVGLIK